MSARFEDISSPPPARLALFAYGFRPFFLAAGLHAVAAVTSWLIVLRTGARPQGLGDPVAWHAHEMLFGFAAAAIAGFLLTAVPNWTGERGFAGGRLMALAGLWLAGRLALNPLAPLPAVPAAIIDLAFFPSLAALVLPSIIKARTKRNYVLVLLLGFLTVAGALYHLDRLNLLAGAWTHGKALGIGMVLLMVSLIGGRIVPSFTSSALRRIGRPVEIAPFGWVDRAALAGIVLMVVADMVQPDGILPGIAALVAAIAHGLRLSRWHGLKTLGQPILWVLHLAYAWIPVGLLLKAAWLLVGIGLGQAWTHAITAGAFATMILAVMSRAALGHTGRDIVAARPTVATYLLLTLAAGVRVAAPVLPDPMLAHAIAGTCWLAAFGLYLLVYAPILVLPRADGRPG
ncbi:NnrS family protein [Niveispirillum sp. KHB5.9]|uniref:NnrS family protein n=1 Tax=Niveispirillum sp. KHB5.9 TaxID=3400269 RepID=UPI003A8C41D6